MKQNNDKQLAIDFDHHLKSIMKQLSSEVVNEHTNKDICVLKSKKGLMELLVVKALEYIKITDSEMASQIVGDIIEQYRYLVEQSLYLVQQQPPPQVNDNQSNNKAASNEIYVLRKQINEKDKQIHDVTIQAEKLN